MKYLKVTYVDAVTDISVAAEPARNGPKLPPVEGLEFVWAAESKYPTDVPEFFCTCPDDSMTAIDGVLEEMFEADWNQQRLDEMRARKPRSLTPRQARLALLKAGLLDEVQGAFAQLPEPERTAAQIEWEFALSVERTSPLVAQMAEAAGLTEAQIDELFVSGAQL